MRVVLALVLLSAACAHVQHEACLGEAQVTEFRQSAEHAIDGVADANGVPPGSSQLVTSTCKTRLYEYRTVRFVAYLSGKATVRLKSVNPAAGPACWTRALADVGALRVAWLDRLLATHHRARSLEWRTPAIGPVSYVACDQPPASRDYLESLANLAHEMQHELRRGPCLYDTSGHDRFCFNLPESLPHRSIAKLEDFGVSEPRQVEALTVIQRTYLTDLDEEPIMLFDELDAYVTTMRAWTALLEARGASAMVTADGRMAMFAPLFALYAVRYLEALRKLDARLYDRTFGAGTKNRRALVALLATAEDAYPHWVVALVRAGREPKDAERLLWERYRTQRQQLGL